MKRVTMLIIGASIPILPNDPFEDLEPLKPKELAGAKFLQSGELDGKRSKGDRKRNPRWSRR